MASAHLRTLVLTMSVVTASCRDAASAVVPRTALGTVAKEWLFAHNQGDGHAMVHYTLGNRGAARMSGAQVDSIVYDGVRFAKAVGPLTPTALVESSDSSLTIELRSENGDAWTARFAPAPQPSNVRVRVAVSPSSPPR
ncbi:MAG TPA: hypothetical protein VM076_16275 [Gemmatimonadaceae bacterium]|nr:hypothetical protein [Gemmatimonadaceae bacterium]